MCTVSNADALQKSKNESVSQATSAAADETVFVFPTNFEKARKTMHVTDIKTEQDLKALKKKDPFMYYSLPGVRESRMRGRDVNLSDVLSAGKSGSGLVSRRSAISLEGMDIDDDLIAEIANITKAEEE